MSTFLLTASNTLELAVAKLASMLQRPVAELGRHHRDYPFVVAS